MKFLCVSCDEAMKLLRVDPPERGSLTVVYRCPKCTSEFAMLTNPFETQVVGSLGVEVGGEPAAGESRCPFTGVVREAGAQPAGPPAAIPWTREASSRLLNVPEFARPMARTGIERFALERGFEEIDAEVLDQARDFFGM